MPLDKLDKELIDLLQADGRASNIELARKTGVSEGTIRRRFRALVDEGIIRVAALPDPAKLGKATAALVGLQVDPAQVDPAAEQLAQLADVQYVSITTGAYDIFVWVAVASPEDLSAFLRARVGSIPGVRRTETFVNLAIKKNPAGPSTLSTG